MNNEPVAWMNPKSLECGYGGEVDWEDTGCIPLYTHPAKTLTDEKITAIAKEIFKDYKNFYHYQIDFARAVIKEVSGK